MTAESRNEEFLKHQGLINIAIKKNYPLLKALQLDIEDVRQELSTRLLIRIEKYDPSRSVSMSTYLSHSLQYEILNIKKKHKAHGVTCYNQGTPLQFLHLDQIRSNGYGYEVPISDDTSGCEIYELLAGLTDAEIEILKLEMKGFHSRKKEHVKTLADIGAKYVEFYNEERGMAA